MAKDGQKRTFTQKAGRFFKRATLCAAFAAAAGGGYNFYGTQADITANVTSVEPTAQGSIIHTDKGNFANTATWVFSKKASDVDDIAAKVKPGAVVKLHVYGAHPEIFGHSPDDAGFFRNITDAVVVSPPPAPVVPVAPPVAVTPAAQPDALPAAPKPANVLTVPAGMINAEGKDTENQLDPEACVKDANLADVSAKAPRLARDMDIMRQLPLTGKPVYDAVTNPKNGIQTCLFPVPLKSGSLSTYDNKHHVRVARGSGTTVTFHEYYHAMQDITGGRNDMFTLTQKDAVVANLMTEASAVAYQLAAQQEALNHGLKFYTQPPYVETWKEGTTTWTQTYTTRDPASNPENVKAFKDAYDASFAANAGLDATARETAALEAGGQAVVTRLLEGKDADWNRTNTDLTVKNINQNLHAFDADASDPGYVAQRDLVFRNQGAVLKGINFIPATYYGADADKAIDTAFTTLGFKFTPVKTSNDATTPAASPRTPASPGPG